MRTLAAEMKAGRDLERLYARHKRDVYRFVLRDVRDPDEAEDITQTAFLDAFRALRRGDEPQQPQAWLLTIAQNVSRRRFRARASRPHEVALDPELLVAPHADGPSAGEIREALLRLRPNQRAVLVLREIGGLSYSEIAETMQLSVPAVETLLFRSRRALRHELTAGEEKALVRVGGLTLWPLPAALSETLGSVTGWLARRGVAAKVAGAVGATVIGTGVAVQAGAVPLPGTASDPERSKAVVAATTSRQAETPPGRASVPAKSVGKKAKKPKRESAAPRPAVADAKGAPVSKDGDSASPGTVPGLTLPQPAAPQLSVPAVSVPLPVEVPDLPTVPEVEVPELPEIPPLDGVLPPDD